MNIRRVLFVLCLGFSVFGVAAMSANELQTNFRPLTLDSQIHLDKQRAYVVSAIAKHLPGEELQKTKADFAVLQKFINLQVVKRTEKWELQSLGVVFGDALASTIPGLAWCEVTDEFGTDPTLRYKQTTLQVNALTMLSKRIEDDKAVDVLEIATWLQDFVMKKSSEC
jgi:Domain of unknown function (DUF3806)